MNKIIIKEVSNKEEIEELRKLSAFTIEGLLLNDENSEPLMDWLRENDALIEGEDVVAHVISGKLMSDSYDLSGKFRYPDDVSIVSFTNIDKMKLITARFGVNGKWLDDLIQNNLDRE